MSDWWCCNCNLLRSLDVHGRCATCGSEAIVPAETGKYVKPSLDAELDREFQKFVRTK